MIKRAFTKVGMTSIFDATGQALGVTLLKMQPAQVVRQEKTEDGRQVVVVEYDIGTKKKLQKGWLVSDSSSYEVGSSLNSPDFQNGQKIKISGRSKGKGFQDVVTRYNFAGGPASHGSRFHRAPGSVGMRTEPGRVPRGKKMPGHMGHDNITLRNVKVAHWSAEEQLVAVLGGVPGPSGSVVFI